MYTSNFLAYQSHAINFNESNFNIFFEYQKVFDYKFEAKDIIILKWFKNQIKKKKKLNNQLLISIDIC